MTKKAPYNAVRRRAAKIYQQRQKAMQLDPRPGTRSRMFVLTDIVFGLRTFTEERKLKWQRLVEWHQQEAQQQT